MAASSQRPKAALVHFDGETLPAWVGPTLEQAGINFVAYDCKTRADLATHAGDADVVWLFGGSLILNGNLDAVPHCRGIVRTGSGTDNIPITEATRRGIVVANTPGAVSDGVSDHLIGLLLTVVRRIAELDRAVRQGRWEQARVQPLNAVQGRTLGLVGFGHIAREVVRKLRGFEMFVLAHDPYVPVEAMSALGVTSAGLDDVLSQADYVSLHCPITEKTRHLIGERELRQMKPTAVLLNTSRGPVLDEAALIRALREGWIMAAGLDVLESEPPARDNPLLTMENVVVTPHVAGYSFNGLEHRWRLSVESVLALARGQSPRSWVNRPIDAGR